MSSEIRLLSESYQVPLHHSIVTIETVERIDEACTSQYFTSVCWGNDTDEDVIFESASREEAFHRQERLCRCFRKYQWFWKPAGKESRVEPMLVPVVA